MHRPLTGLAILVVMSIIGLLIPVEVLAGNPDQAIVKRSHHNPYKRALKEAKAEHKKAQKNFENLIRRGSANMGQLMAAMFSYTRARSRYESVKRLYDNWEKNNKKKKATVKRVRITYNVPWMSTADAVGGTDEIKAKHSILPGGCYPMPRYLHAVANYGSRSAVYYRITGGHRLARKYVNQDVKMKGIFRRDKFLYNGTVQVLKVKASKPVHKHETKTVTIERHYLNIMPLCGTTGAGAEEGEIKSLGCIAPTPQMSFKVDVGKRFKFGLKTNPSTGYGWEYRFTRPGIARVVPTITPLYHQEDNPNNSQGQMLIGAPTTRWFTIQGMRHGRTKMLLEYKRSWEKGIAERMEIDITVEGPITPPPSKATYYAVEGQGRRYRVTNDTVHVVKRYVGQTVELTGEFTALDFILQSKDDNKLQASTGQTDNKEIACPPWRPTPTADGIVKAIRIKPRVEPGKVQTRVVRIDGIMLKCMPPRYKLYCIEESAIGRRVYDIVSGTDRCKQLMGSLAEVTGVWNFPDVWIPEIRPRGTVRVIRAQGLAVPFKGEKEHKGTVSTDLNNPFGN